MLDIKLFRTDPDQVRAAMSARGIDPVVVDQILQLDSDWRDVVTARD